LWMNVKEAKDFLLSKGFVFSLRPKRRKRDHYNPTGYREVLSYDGFGKKGVVFVKFVKLIKSDDELLPFVKLSGFNDLKEWKEKARDSRFLYLIQLLEVI